MGGGVCARLRQASGVWSAAHATAPAVGECGWGAIAHRRGMETRYRKQRTALRHLLLGRGWYGACRALEMAAGYHTGMRKDGTTPEFSHQVAIALWVWTLEPQLLHPEETVSAALLHDVCEDYDVGFEEIEVGFGPLVAGAVRALTKEHRGVKFGAEQVDDAIAEDPIASIVKPGDRIHNHDSMVGVFGPEKIASYVAETESHILPTLKRARRRFPVQEQAYQNAKLTLEAQVRLLKAMTPPEPSL